MIPRGRRSSALRRVASGAEPVAERKTVSGTIDQYLRITTTGTFTNADIAIGYRRGLTGDDVAYT